MSKLSPTNRALLDAARSARAPAACREHVDTALASRLGSAVVLGAAATSTTLPASTAASAASSSAATAGSSVTARLLASKAAAGTATVLTTGKVLIIGAVLSAVSAGVFVTATRDATGPSRSTRPPAVTTGAAKQIELGVGAATTPPQDGAIVAATSPAEIAASAKASETAPPRTADRALAASAPATRSSTAPPASRGLGHETALLEQAFRSIDDGDSAHALAALDELEASKPNGALAEERAALRVLALCAAGRVDEARAAAERFLAEMPRSMQAGRVRASCAFSKPESP